MAANYDTPVSTALEDPKHYSIWICFDFHNFERYIIVFRLFRINYFRMNTLYLVMMVYLGDISMTVLISDHSRTVDLAVNVMRSSHVALVTQSWVVSERP